MAGDQISRTAIFFVETGKAKPSMETLRLIAERTGRPLDFFLARPAEGDPALYAGTAELERLIATGALAEVVSTGDRLLEQRLDPNTEATVRHLVAIAHLRLGQPVVGRRMAAAARAHFERVGDMLMTAECLCSEAQGAYLMQDPAALSLAEGALATARSLKTLPPSTEVRLLGTLAAVHVTDRNWPAAIAAYESAIAAGDAIHDLRRLSLIYNDLSLAYQELGQINQATHYGRRALTIHETLNDRISLARSENNLGLLLVRVGEADSARTHLERSLRLFEETGAETGKSDVLLSLSELEFTQSNFGAAAALAQEAMTLATKEAAAGRIADAHIWLGRIADAEGRDDAAEADFEAAIGVLEEAGAAERLALARAAYAEVLEARGDLAGANRQLRQALAAARSPRPGPDARAATA